MIKLNVGGSKFTTKIETLRKIPYFANGLNDSELTEKIFVDRSGFIFDHVLSWARDDNYLFPEEYKLELDFYGVDLDRVKFRESSLLDKISKLESLVVKCLTEQNIVIKDNEWMCIFPGCEEHDRGNNYCKLHYKKGLFCDKRGCFGLTEEDARFCHKHKTY